MQRQIIKCADQLVDHVGNTTEKVGAEGFEFKAYVLIC